MDRAAERKPENVELVRNYRPLGIKALRAAVAVKAQPSRHHDIPRPTGTGLPEGFHWPEDIQD